MFELEMYNMGQKLKSMLSISEQETNIESIYERTHQK